MTWVHPIGPLVSLLFSLVLSCSLSVTTHTRALPRTPARSHAHPRAPTHTHAPSYTPRPSQVKLKAASPNSIKLKVDAQTINLVLGKHFYWSASDAVAAGLKA